MKKLVVIALVFIGIASISFFSVEGKVTKYHSDGIDGVNFSSNPPAARTGAPGEANCTACHAGTAMSAEGVVFFTVGGGPNYTPGETYPISIATVGGSKNGFELTILDGSDNQAGTLAAGPNTSIISEGGRQYIRHSASEGMGSWTFDWTAPATNVGELTAYYSFNKANNNDGSSGDEIFLGSTAIPPFNVSIAENPLEKGYNVSYNNLTKQVSLNYSLIEKAKVVLNVQDLSGRLIQTVDFGYKTTGDYSEQLTLNELDISGMYVVSLFINKRVLNRKLMITN
jgi:hypothetical protein